MARIDFIQQLQALGYTPQELANNFLVIEYQIPAGKFINQVVTLALQVDDSFPMNAPPGPHFNPHLLPITGGGGSHPYGGIHRSPLGADWQYWSRPFKEWNKTERSVKVYLSHLRNLLSTVI